MKRGIGDSGSLAVYNIQVNWTQLPKYSKIK